MNISKKFAFFASGTALLALAYAVAQAACIGCQPIGGILTCGIGLFNCTVSSLTTPTGTATFTTNNAVTAPTFKVVAANRGGEGVVASTSLQPVKFQGTGTSPTLGAVNWQFDLSRTVVNSTIVADQTGRDFPATLTLNFHIRGTIAAYPGVTFESVTPLKLVGTVTSFDPLVNESLTLSAPVQLRNVNNPQQTLTINALTLKLNG